MLSSALKMWVCRSCNNIFPIYFLELGFTTLVVSKGNLQLPQLQIFGGLVDKKSATRAFSLRFAKLQGHRLATFWSCRKWKVHNDKWLFAKLTSCNEIVRFFTSFPLMNLTSIICWFPESLSAIYARKIKNQGFTRSQRSSKIPRFHFFSPDDFSPSDITTFAPRGTLENRQLWVSTYEAEWRWPRKIEAGGTQLQRLTVLHVVPSSSRSVENLRLADPGPPRQHCFIQCFSVGGWSDLWFFKMLTQGYQGPLHNKKRLAAEARWLEMTLSNTKQECVFFDTVLLLIICYNFWCFWNRSFFEPLNHVLDSRML